MSTLRCVAAALAALMLPVGASAAADFRKNALDSLTEHTKGNGKDDNSPFRKALKKKLQGRAKGPARVDLPDPELVAIEDGIGWGPGDCAEKKRCPTPGYVVKFSVQTGLGYDGPDEVNDPPPGGKASWPDLKLRRFVQDEKGDWVPAFNDDGSEAYDDYTAQYKQKVADELAALGMVAWLDADHPDGLYVFGEEPRDETVVEEITFTFKKSDQAQGKAFFKQLAAALAAGDLDAEKAILMGFTYQGPNLDYTVGDTERGCLFGVCVTAWDIRAGFALDFGVGVRLPARAVLEGPAQMIAGNSYAFSSTISTVPPPDNAGDWGAADFTAAGVNPYSDRGEPKGQGNEFVMYFDFFAGAKVLILGVDVCPWCVYVDITKDYSASFATPFGPGNSLQLPSVDIPVKKFNAGLVALEVGLRVNPSVGSRDITALASTGAVLTHSSSGVPASFGVNACIAGEAPRPRYQAVSLDGFRYNFDTFNLTFEAYLIFSVLGYGAWDPSYPFFTLNLMDVIGTLTLPNHENWDLTFNRTPAPAVQQVVAQSEVLDQSPPSTAFAPSGTPGKNGWWISDVTGTLTAVDNPPGCGSGVATTVWSADGAAPQSTNPFVLTAEKNIALSFASTDRDGNVETAQTQQVSIDKTPPTISGAATTSPNPYGWYNHDVTVHFVASDATSGVASVTPDTTLSAEAANQSVTGTAEDFAGLTKSATVGGINIDKTAPTVAINAPAASGYPNTATFNFSWTATDALSGIASESATLDGAAVTKNQLIEVVYLAGGDHTASASATDKAGNTGTKTVTFLVDVDIDGLIFALNRVCANGWIRTPYCNSLRDKASNAKASLAASAWNDARGQLASFINELDAQRGKNVQERAWALLRTDAVYVMKRYGLVPAV